MAHWNYFRILFSKNTFDYKKTSTYWCLCRPRWAVYLTKVRSLFVFSSNSEYLSVCIFICIILHVGHVSSFKQGLEVSCKWSLQKWCNLYRGAEKDKGLGTVGFHFWMHTEKHWLIAVFRTAVWILWMKNSQHSPANNCCSFPPPKVNKIFFLFVSVWHLRFSSS